MHLFLRPGARERGGGRHGGLNAEQMEEADSGFVLIRANGVPHQLMAPAEWKLEQGERIYEPPYLRLPGKLDDVLIFREVDGRKYIGVYNLSAIYRGNYEDPALYPDDIVMVGDSPARRRAESLLQLFSLAITPVILIDRLVN